MYDSLKRKDGFLGQIQFVIPQSTRKMMQQHPLLHTLMPSDIGWYPTAQYHYRERPDGSSENILIFCVDGYGWCEIDGERCIVEPNHCLIIPAECAHTYGASLDDPWSIYWSHFSGMHSAYFVNQLRENEYQIAVSEQARERLIDLFEQCFETLNYGFALQNLLFTSTMVHYMLGVLLFGNRLFSPGMQSSSFHDLTSVVQWLRNNIDRKITLEEMANEAGLSVSHFSQLFKQQIGSAPITYFINLKIQYACHLLDTTDLPIKSISYAVGYDDPYYFSRLFRKAMKTSPKTYRNIPKG